jgi:NADPH2:quinone reductase
MRRVVCHEIGPLDRLTVETSDDELAPGPGQVVVDVAAAGVNYVDALFVQGRYQIKPPTPFTPGSEIAGVVASVGDGVDGWAVGDRVLTMCGLGGFASQVVLNALSLSRVPDAMELDAAAAFIQSYCTALFALSRRTSVGHGDVVLVLGAGGGVGLAAIDVATALGARVVAAASSADKRDAALRMGAETAIDYTTEDLKTRARELSGKGGVDVVFDPVGGEASEAALRATGPFGRHVVIGFTAGIPALPLNLVLLHNRTLVGVDWGAWTGRDPAGQRALLDDALAMVAGGRLHPPAPQRFPLDETPEVLAALLDRGITGKAVVVP